MEAVVSSTPGSPGSTPIQTPVKIHDLQTSKTE